LGESGSFRLIYLILCLFYKISIFLYKNEGQLSSVARPRKHVPGNSRPGGAPWVSRKRQLETIAHRTVLCCTIRYGTARNDT